MSPSPGAKEVSGSLVAREVDKPLKIPGYVSDTGTTGKVLKPVNLGEELLVAH